MYFFCVTDNAMSHTYGHFIKMKNAYPYIHTHDRGMWSLYFVLQCDIRTISVGADDSVRPQNAVFFQKSAANPDAPACWV